MGKISVVFVTALICIFLISQSSQTEKTSITDDRATSNSGKDDKDSNSGRRNIRIEVNATENYVTFTPSHIDSDNNQYRYKIYPLACGKDDSEFGNWIELRKGQRLTVPPYANVTFQIRHHNNDTIIGENSTVTPAKEPEARVTSLQCTRIKCMVTWEENCTKYNGDNVTVQFTLKPSSEKLKNTSVSLVNLERQEKEFRIRDLDLLPFMNYTVTASLANNAGAATDSSLTKQVFFITKPKEPGRVSSLAVTQSTPSSLHVVWTAPDDHPPKGKLSRYSLQWRILGGTTNAGSRIVNESVTSFNITELYPATIYKITVSAKNAGNNGYGTDVSVINTTKEEGAADPKSGTEEIDEKRTLRFSWNASRRNSGETHLYKVIFSDGDNETEQNTNDTHITLTGLTPGKKYTLKVQACSAAGHCDQLMTREDWTRPEQPRVDENTELDTTTATTIIIQLPVLKNPPGLLWVLLKKYSGVRDEDVAKEALEMVIKERETERKNEEKSKETQAKTRKRRSADPDQNDDKLRIAAKVEVVEGQEPKKTVTVGGDWNGGDGLEDVTEYVVVIVTETRAGPYSAFKASEARVMRTVPRPQEYDILGMIFGMCAAAVFLIFLYAVLVRIRNRRPRKDLPDEGYCNAVVKEDNPIVCSIPRDAAMIMPMKDSHKNILPLENKWKAENDNKDALQEDLYANIKQQVGEKDLENYLPRAIHAVETTLEFNSVPFFMPGKTSNGSFIPENVPKNRYKNSISYDDTRVKLPLYQNIPHTDYINANFVQDPSGHAAFIATQGPKDKNADTIGAFWRMIWHSECRLILMVANLVEGGKAKVAQYWPEKEPLVKEGVKVTLTSVQVLMDYAVRTFTVAVNGKERTVKQYHYMAWPDHGVPQTAYGLGYMLKAVIKDYAKEPQGPITVHCSAGIGRTGTIIITLFLLRQLRAFKAIDTKKALTTLREGRGRLVENAEQYIFVHKLLYDILFGMRTTHSCQSFVREVATLLSAKDSDGKLVLQKEFENMKKLPKDLTFKHGSNPECAHLNRNQDILPADQRMMFVQMFGRGSDSQYVNLVRVHGFDRKDAYLAGEHPQLHSLAKIWNLVYENRISVWLLLQEFPPNDQSFPNVVSETSAVPKNMTLEISQPIHLTNFTEYTATLSVRETDHWRIHKCTLLMLKGWPHTAKLPSSPLPLLGAIEKAESLQLPQTPLLFTCSDGVTACGVMATLLLAVCRAKLTQEVDLHRSAVSVLYDRPQFITDLMQYQFLFRAMEAFLNENNHYGNFA